MYNKRVIGTEKEQLACDYLTGQGYEIITCNYFCRGGEIDIIAKDGNYLVFIEVKYRKSVRNGSPEEAVTVRKMQRIIKTANQYLLRHGISFDTPCRFDVVVIREDKLTLYENAFSVNDGYRFL